MIGRLRPRLTYANVMATIALFIALGGSSYAAFRLPRDSVGARQIRKSAVGGSEIRRGAVRSSEIRNHSVQTRDMSAKAVASLRGSRRRRTGLLGGGQLIWGGRSGQRRRRRQNGARYVRISLECRPQAVRRDRHARVGEWRIASRSPTGVCHGDADT
jgi:hypothetical protein